MGFVLRCFRAERWFFAGLVFWVEELVDELRERDFLEPDIRHSGLEVSSAGFRLLSLSPSSFCVLVPSSVLRPLHDDQMGAVYLERLDGQLDLFKLPSQEPGHTRAVPVGIDTPGVPVRRHLY